MILRLTIIALFVLAIVGLGQLGRGDAKPHYRSLVICPTWPPCWKDGKPIVGAL